MHIVKTGDAYVKTGDAYVKTGDAYVKTLRRIYLKTGVQSFAGSPPLLLDLCS